MTKINLDDFGIVMEFVKRVQYGNVEATLISDTHLQNARIRAYKKLAELNERRNTLLSCGYPISREMQRKTGFYKSMLATCEGEIYRRFMHKDLISIPYTNYVSTPIQPETVIMDSPF